MAQADAEWAAIGGGLLPAEVQRLGSLGEDGAKDLITAALDCLVGTHDEIRYHRVLDSSVNNWGEYRGYVRTLVRDMPLPAEHTRGVSLCTHPRAPAFQVLRRLLFELERPVAENGSLLAWLPTARDVGKCAEMNCNPRSCEP